MLSVIFVFLSFIAGAMWLFAPKSDLTKRIVTMQAAYTLLSVVIEMGFDMKTADGLLIGAAMPIALALGWLFGVKVMDKVNPEGKRFTYLIINGAATGLAYALGLFAK